MHTALPPNLIPESLEHLRKSKQIVQFCWGVSRGRRRRRCHLDKAQFVRCGGGGGIGSHFDEDISRASERVESSSVLFNDDAPDERVDGWDRSAM